MRRWGKMGFSEALFTLALLYHKTFYTLLASTAKLPECLHICVLLVALSGFTAAAGPTECKVCLGEAPATESLSSWLQMWEYLHAPLANWWVAAETLISRDLTLSAERRGLPSQMSFVVGVLLVLLTTLEFADKTLEGRRGLTL